MIGSELDGRYEIRRRLGQGGMGAVYEATDVRQGRAVAIKVIHAEDLTTKPNVVKRFHRETRATSVVQSRHIVEVLDTGTDPETGRPYMVMELLRGEDAGQLLERIGALRPDAALRIASQTCLGIQQAHEARVIHRDVKPANLFLAEQDDGEIVVKILDFGVAKIKMENAEALKDSGLTRTGGMVGSPPYMSPEQARGAKHVDFRADIWSLAIVLYQLLCSRTPFQDAEGFGDLIMSICGEPVPPLQQFAPWVSPEAAAVVHDALRCSPDDRFQNATDMLAALDALLPEGRRLTKGELGAVDEATRATVARKLTVVPSTERGAGPGGSRPAHDALLAAPAVSDSCASGDEERRASSEPSPKCAPGRSSHVADALDAAGRGAAHPDLAHTRDEASRRSGRRSMWLALAAIAAVGSTAAYFVAATDPAATPPRQQPSAHRANGLTVDPVSSAAASAAAREPEGGTSSGKESADAGAPGSSGGAGGTGDHR